MKTLFFTFKNKYSEGHDDYIAEIIDEAVKEKKVIDVKMTSTVSPTTTEEQLYTQILIIYEDM